MPVNSLYTCRGWHSAGLKLSIGLGEVFALSMLLAYSGTRVDVSRKHASHVAFSSKKATWKTFSKGTLTLVPLLNILPAIVIVLVRDLKFFCW
jgi:hypothetical protein